MKIKIKKLEAILLDRAAWENFYKRSSTGVREQACVDMKNLRHQNV